MTDRPQRYRYRYARRPHLRRFSVVQDRPTPRAILEKMIYDEQLPAT